MNVVFKAQPGASSVIEQFDGFNLRNTDALRSLVVGAREFSSTCLAPYPGWNVFFADAISNYRRFRHVLGYRQLDRVGVRFINRIDIPHVHPTQEIMLSDYFTISPNNLTINTANPDLKYSEYFISMHINYDLPIRVMLQTGLTPSALVDHRAVMLDIDASVMGAPMVPQNEAALEELLTRLRTAKNDIFERSITNTTRVIAHLGGRPT